MGVSAHKTLAWRRPDVEEAGVRRRAGLAAGCRRWFMGESLEAEKDAVPAEHMQAKAAVKSASES